MTFTVTYRANDGAKREETVDAANRAECVAALKARGIVPTSIREGRSGMRATQGGVGRAANVSAAPCGGTWKAAILAAVVLAVVGGGLWWWLGRADTPSSQLQGEKPKARTKVVSPPSKVTGAQEPQKISQPTNMSAVKAADPVSAQPPTTNEPPRKLTMAERGIRVVKPRKQLRPRRFKYNAEEHIAFFLETEPGAVVFGEIPYGPKFVEDFKASLNEPVAILPDDSEDVRLLKKAVQETKEDLKSRMEAGEDVAKIMQESRAQLIELGRYKSTLEDELKKIAKGGEFNEEEFGKFVNAANKMLEAKGLSPIKSTRMMYKMLELKARRSNRK